MTHMSTGKARNEYTNGYFQEGPRLGNQLLEDISFERYLRTLIPGKIVNDLIPFGDKCGNEYMKMAHNAELFKPVHEQHDAWGKRVDKIHVGEGWKYFKRESAVEGIVAIPYENQDGEFSRIHQAAKIMLFAPSSGMFSCPLAMTDGAAFVIRDMLKHRSKFPPETVAKLENAYAHLTSRNPDSFWTSGQWFTEKKGGSDLSTATDTIAIKDTDNKYRLHGYKWFTSAIDAEMTLTLASIENSTIKNDRKPLSLFFLEVRNHEPTPAQEEEDRDLLNGIQVVRLKDKMGTRQLPTAEITLNGSEAYLLSEPGVGIKSVSPMLVITRYHNSVAAVSNMMRMRNLVFDFALRRTAFGDKIINKPLHKQSLFEFDATTRGNLCLVLEFARLLGLSETGKASADDKALLRIITPISKLFTARETVRLMSEGVEMFGAVGIMENSHITVLLRDSSVLPIWEGTTNTLSLDVLRVIAKSPQSLAALKKSIVKQLEPMADAIFAGITPSNPQLLEWNAKRITLNLSRLLVTNLMIKMASNTKCDDDLMAADFWVHRLETETEKMATLNTASLSYSQDFGKNRDARGKLRSSL